MILVCLHGSEGGSDKEWEANTWKDGGIPCFQPWPALPLHNLLILGIMDMDRDKLRQE